MHENILVPLETAPSGMAFISRKRVLLRSIDPERFPSEVARILIAEGIRSTCSIPMISHGQALGTLSVGSLCEAAFTEEDAGVLSQVTNQIAMAVETRWLIARLQNSRTNSAKIRNFILSVDLSLLSAIQGWRFAGIGFLALYAHDVLPGMFAWPAGLGDMAIGISAPWVAFCPRLTAKLCGRQDIPDLECARDSGSCRGCWYGGAQLHRRGRRCR